MRRTRLLLPVLFLFAVRPALSDELRLHVRFVGNSLTYSSELPAMVARIPASDDRRTYLAALTTYRALGASLPPECGASSSAAPREADRAALLALHEKVMLAHREGKVELLLADEREDYTVANRGVVTRPALADRRARLGPYLSSTRFDVYRDRVAPIVRVADDGSLGWVVVEIEAKGVQRAGDGTEAPIEFVSAWIELYEKRDGRWFRVGNVSNFKP